MQAPSLTDLSQGFTILFSKASTRAFIFILITSMCYPKVLCCAQSLQSCPSLCNPKDYGPPGSSVHGILQARTLEWVAMLSSVTTFSSLLMSVKEISTLPRLSGIHQMWGWPQMTRQSPLPVAKAKKSPRELSLYQGWLITLLPHYSSFLMPQSLTAIFHESTSHPQT